MWVRVGRIIKKLNISTTQVFIIVELFVIDQIFHNLRSCDLRFGLLERLSEIYGKVNQHSNYQSHCNESSKSTLILILIFISKFDGVAKFVNFFQNVTHLKLLILGIIAS